MYGPIRAILVSGRAIAVVTVQGNASIGVVGGRST